MILLSVFLTWVGKNASSILGQLTGAAQIKSVAGIILIISLVWPRISKNTAFYTLVLGSAVAVGWHMTGNPFGIQPLWPALAVTFVSLGVMTALTGERVSQDYLRYREIMRQYEELPEEGQ